QCQRCVGGVSRCGDSAGAAQPVPGKDDDGNGKSKAMRQMRDADFVDYARLSYRQIRHHKRYVRRIESMPKKLICQECGGRGGEIDVVIPESGQGPWVSCGWCEGVGFVTPWLRGRWLRTRRANLDSPRKPWISGAGTNSDRVQTDTRNPGVSTDS